MACLICNHTMQGVGRNEAGFRQFWCPRCGTVKTENGDHESWEAPRWVRLLLDAQWHEVKEELLSAGRMQKSLAELKLGSEEVKIVPGKFASNAVENR